VRSALKHRNDVRHKGAEMRLCGFWLMPAPFQQIIVILNVARDDNCNDLIWECGKASGGNRRRV